MKRLMLVGQTLSGKTTLLQKLRGLPLRYQKTQSLECEIYPSILLGNTWKIAVSTAL